MGGVSNEETVNFYRAADLLVYPSFNETFGLPILEAMACACPVVTSSISSMPEIAGGAALLADPHDPRSIARAMVDGCGIAASRLRTEGILRAGQFTWAVVAQATLDAYRRGRRAESLTPPSPPIPPPQGASSTRPSTLSRSFFNSPSRVSSSIFTSSSSVFGLHFG